MTFLRLLNVQGIARIAVSLALAVLLVIQKGETRHWRKSSGQFEQLHRDSQAALAGTVANYRAAADAACAADKVNADRVRTEQAHINQETSDEFQARLASVRAAAERLRQGTPAAADPGNRGAAPVPRLPVASGQSHDAAGENRLPRGSEALDWRLTATEQAIQLDELIKWVAAQAKVDNNASPVASPAGRGRH